MLSHRIATEIRLCLDNGQFRRARSVLEQGIVTMLAEEKIDDGFDADNISCLDLGVRIQNALEMAGIFTIGQLRRRMHEIETGNFWQIGTKAIGDVKRSLRTYGDKGNSQATFQPVG